MTLDSERQVRLRPGEALPRLQLREIVTAECSPVADTGHPALRTSRH